MIRLCAIINSTIGRRGASAFWQIIFKLAFVAERITKRDGPSLPRFGLAPMEGFAMKNIDELNYVLKNKPLPQGAMAAFKGLVEDGEKPLFVIVGDLKKNGRYCDTLRCIRYAGATTIDTPKSAFSIREFPNARVSIPTKYASSQ